MTSFNPKKMLPNSAYYVTTDIYCTDCEITDLFKQDKFWKHPLYAKTAYDTGTGMNYGYWLATRYVDTVNTSTDLYKKLSLQIGLLRCDKSGIYGDNIAYIGSGFVHGKQMCTVRPMIEIDLSKCTITSSEDLAYSYHIEPK